MGLVPDHWGPYVWGAIHLICLGAPEKLDMSQQQAYKFFFEHLPFVLPCASCAKHLAENLQKVPINDYLSSRDLLFEWSVKLHNVVNVMLKKKEVSLEEAKTYWDAICRGNKTNILNGKVVNNSGCDIEHTDTNRPKKKYYLYYLLLLIIFMLLFYIGYLYGKGSATRAFRNMPQMTRRRS